MKQIQLMLIWVASVGAQSAPGQTEIAPSRQVAIPVSGDGVFVYATRPDGGSVSIVRGASSNSGPASNQFQVLVTAANGTTKTYELANALQGPLIVFRSYVIFSRWHRPLPETWALNLETGQEVPLKLGFYAFKAAASTDKVVLVGKAGMGMDDPLMLGVLDASLKLTTYPLASLTNQQLQHTDLSFDAEDRFLVLDRAEAAYWPLQVGSTVTLGERRELRGSEVDESRKRAKLPVAPTPVGGRLARAALVLGHVKAKNGRDLFFFGPYHASEGYRVGEFDQQGKQLSSYRFTLPGASPGRDATCMSTTLATTADAIEVMTLGGTKRSYARP